jgi:hypothetical protein
MCKPPKSTVFDFIFYQQQIQSNKKDCMFCILKQFFVLFLLFAEHPIVIIPTFNIRAWPRSNCNIPLFRGRLSKLSQTSRGSRPKNYYL